jgi:hypothetical protein
MNSWSRVKWTEAGQVAELLGWDEPLGERGSLAPQAFFESLKAEGRLSDAAFFLGQALPRFETVAWAARAVRDLRAAQPVERPAPDRDALKAALLWIQDPSEPRRRAAGDAAEAAADDSAERLAALAVFFSGGSIAPPDCEPVPAPREAAGQLAATAVVVAAMGAAPDEADRALASALAAGAQVAERGVSASSAPE